MLFKFVFLCVESSLRQDELEVPRNKPDAKEGFEWHGLARTVVLGMLDKRHNDIDRRSLALESYHSELDAFAANAVLAGRSPGSFLVRLSNSTSFVASLVKPDRTVAHFALIRDGVSKNGKTVREHVAANNAACRTPVLRRETSSEFVVCSFTARECGHVSRTYNSTMIGSPKQQSSENALPTFKRTKFSRSFCRSSVVHCV